MKANVYIDGTEFDVILTWYALKALKGYLDENNCHFWAQTDYAMCRKRY